MWSTFLKTKIHGATVTDANLEYRGSISIAPELIQASGLRVFERVEIYNITNGERFATYVIEGRPGEICINGAAAWKARPRDKVIIAAYVMLSEEQVLNFKPTVVMVGEGNRIEEVLKGRV